MRSCCTRKHADGALCPPLLADLLIDAVPALAQVVGRGVMRLQNKPPSLLYNRVHDEIVAIERPRQLIMQVAMQ